MDIFKNPLKAVIALIQFKWYMERRKYVKTFANRTPNVFQILVKIFPTEKARNNDGTLLTIYI